MRKKILTGIIVGCCFVSAAQDETTPEKEKSYGKASLNFINNYVYYGRKDSVTTPYLTPSLGFFHKSGFYIEGSFSYLFRSGNSRVDLSAIDAGYDFTLGNFHGGIATEKLFYNKNSTNVQAEVKGEISAMAFYDFSFIETYLQPGIDFGSKNDYWLSWGIDHLFAVADEKLEINPSFVLNTATRNLYASYIANRRFKPKNGTQPPTVTASLKDASSLKIMDYELSMPFSYSIKNFSFGFTPYFSIPTNPAVVTVIIKPVMGPAITKVITEKTESTFYLSLDAAIKF